MDEIATTSSSGLAYDASKDEYHYNWKTAASWSGTCRQLTLKLIDGTSRRVLFQFK